MYGHRLQRLLHQGDRGPFVVRRAPAPRRSFARRAANAADNNPQGRQVKGVPGLISVNDAGLEVVARRAGYSRIPKRVRERGLRRCRRCVCGKPSPPRHPWSRAGKWRDRRCGMPPASSERPRAVKMEARSELGTRSQKSSNTERALAGACGGVQLQTSFNIQTLAVGTGDRGDITRSDSGPRWLASAKASGSASAMGDNRRGACRGGPHRGAVKLHSRPTRYKRTTHATAPCEDCDLGREAIGN